MQGCGMAKPTKGKNISPKETHSLLISYLKKNTAIFLSSAKNLGLRVPLIMFLDFLLYFIAYLGVSAGARTLQEKYDQIPFPQTLQGITTDQASLLLSQAQSFYYHLIGAIIIGAFIFIVLWSLFKGIVWALTLREKITPRLLWRFLLLNALWMTLWLALLSSLAYLTNLSQAKYVILGLIALFIMLTNGMYALFVKNPSLSSAKKGIGLTFRTLHLLLLPYMLALLLYLVLLKPFTFVSGLASQIGLLVATLAYFTICRAYLSHLVVELGKEETSKD
jgi:hypothetical protein